MVFLQVIVILMLASFGSTLGQRKHNRNIPVGADVKKSLNFNCPEEFGYYPHPADCTQYYVCVFGGALLESCTGGLMYSHELQTCDWPRNVGCDSTVEVTTPSITYQSSSPNRSQEPKIRYTHPPPPPVPPQPAAVVTSRGQPRQLHHTQQDIVKQKQQQQLYVDAEEALPPAEEIENDRQQRVYRGQPSTVGQVQRDRDGLRQHTNAIPLSSDRGEKIGVISFGTQHSLPEYRKKTDNDDFDTNSLTTSNHYRFKRQVGRSLSYGTDIRQFIAEQSYPNGHRSPPPTFQTTYLKAPHGSPYRADISKNKPSISFLSIASPITNNDQRIGLFKNSQNNEDYLFSGPYDQNYQYFNLNHGSPQHALNPYIGKIPLNINNDKQVVTKFNYNSDGFVPSMHFSLSGKKYKEVSDVDAYLKSSTTSTNSVYKKPPTTELIPVSKRPDSIFKQYLTVSSDKPKTNTTFNILSFLNYFRPSQYETSTISLTHQNTTKRVKPTTEAYSTSRKTLYSVPYLKKTNNHTGSDYVDDYMKKDPSESSLRGVQKYPERNNSFYDEYYDYSNETEYYYDDLNLLTLNYSANLKIVTTTTGPSVTTRRAKPRLTVTKPYITRGKYKSSSTSPFASATTRTPFSSIRPTANSGHRLSTTHRIESKGNRPIEQTISTATPKAIYNNTNQYDSSRYDSYYALYDDDVDLYKDIEYAQHYHTEPPAPSPSPKQTYRGTPAPVTHQLITQEKPSKLSNSAYIQNTYSTSDDIYEPADIQSYNEENYNTQDDHQTVYHQSKQTNRGDRNELNYIEEPATTKRITTTTTTTTVTTPRQYPTQKNVRIPARYSNTANQNEVRVQPTHYTLPEDPESKIISPIPKPTILFVNVPDLPVQKPIVSQPSAFSFSKHSTTPKTLFFHYITKTSKSTSVVSTTPNPLSTSYTPVNKKSNRPNVTNHKIIMPTTYSPPYFIRKSLLRIRPNLDEQDSVKVNSNWKETDKSVAPQLDSSEPNKIKAPLKLLIHPSTINNELWSSTNIAVGDIEEEEITTDPPSTVHYNRGNDVIENVASSSTESFKQFRYHSLTTSTTTTTTTEPIKSVTDLNEISTSEAFTLDNDLTNTSWLLLLERLNSITHDNKTLTHEVESYDTKSNFSLTEKQISITSNPIENVTKKTFSSRITPIPTRASRVNTAIKSIITFGGPQRQNSKCSDDKTSTAKCGKINQRVSSNNNRGRGSSHYTSSGRTNENNVVNRGTPAPRSRPTLKPSTSVIAKAAEFVDIYRYLPRRPDPIYPQPLPDKTAAKCRKDVCLLPDCSCGGREIPGDLPVEQVPQMVLLTYDDSVNDLNKGLYHDLFEKGRVNPNGCPIAATFYVSHEWTDYSQVQNLYSDGHELASHTVSHSFGEQFSQKKWTKEVAGQREILSAYGGVHLEDVRGMRAPFLSVGGNKMFKMLYDSNFTYDSSMPIYENKPPSWPYTLDYKLFHDCMIPPCPTRSYPGVWEVPMVMWQDLNGGRCSMGDACSNPSDAEGVYKMIMKNFERHYTSNRAPFGLFYHAAWFTQPHHKEGFIQFLDAINSMKDVWLVTNWQAIQWVRDPTPVSRLNSFQPFGCNYPDRPKRCNNPKVCNLWHKTGVRYMRTCQPCPEIYPWTGNTGIHSSRIDNELEE